MRLVLAAKFARLNRLEGNSDPKALSSELPEVKETLEANLLPRHNVLQLMRQSVTINSECVKTALTSGLGDLSKLQQPQISLSAVDAVRELVTDMISTVAVEASLIARDECRPDSISTDDFLRAFALIGLERYLPTLHVYLNGIRDKQNIVLNKEKCPQERDDGANANSDDDIEYNAIVGRLMRLVHVPFHIEFDKDNPPSLDRLRGRMGRFLNHDATELDLGVSPESPGYTIKGSQVQRSHALLEIVDTPDPSKLGGKRTDLKFLGIVNSMTTFTSSNAMADYYYSPSVSNEDCIVGPFFSTLQTPKLIPAVFKTNDQKAPVVKHGDPNVDEGTTNLYTVRASAPIGQVPMDCDLPTDLSEESNRIIKHLQSLFANRPVWSGTSLSAALAEGGLLTSESPLWKFRVHLRYVSYCFADGPFRRCYVRFGVDPRSSPDYRKYQVIDFRDPTLRHSRRTASNDKDSLLDLEGKTDPYFVKPPDSMSQLYQLCDIRDNGVQKTISGPCLSSFDAVTGWLSRGSRDAIRDHMKAKSSIMRRSRA